MRKPIVVFRKLPVGILGECDYQKGIISIDLTKDTNPLRTYIHECLHWCYPGRSETWIRNMEKLSWQKICNNQRSLFIAYKALFNRKFRSIKELGDV